MLSDFQKIGSRIGITMLSALIAVFISGSTGLYILQYNIVNLTLLKYVMTLLGISIYFGVYYLLHKYIGD